MREFLMCGVRSCNMTFPSGGVIREGPTRMPRGGEVSEYLFETGLCLPSGTQMIEEDLERVVDVLKNSRRRNKS